MPILFVGSLSVCRPTFLKSSTFTEKWTVLHKLFKLFKKCINSINQYGKLEAVVQRCSAKNVFLKISQTSQEYTCARVSFLIKLQAGGCFCEAKKNFKENNQKYKHCCVHEIFCLFLDRFFLNILQLTHCLSFFYININKKRTYYINKIDKKKKFKE